MNMKTILQAALASVFIVPAGCGSSYQPIVPGITDQNATAIVLDHNRTLMDFVYITPEMDIDRIEFYAPESGEEIYVYALGPNVHETIRSNVAITSMQAEGFRGRVTVNIEDGLITRIYGNGFSQGRPVSSGVLNKIADIKRTGYHQPQPSTVIVAKDRLISKLAEDQDGNLVPPDMTLNESQFLDVVVPAIRSRDISALRPLIHKRQNDGMPFCTVENFFSNVVFKHDVVSIRFTRIDFEHPDNKEYIEADYSLPVHWILRINFKTLSPSVRSSSDIAIGVLDETLMIPTKYARRDS